MTTSLPTIGDDFRQAMRGVAATVTLITAGSGDARQAMAATAFSAVSMDPPLVLICVNRSSLIHPLFTPNAPFCVNILSVSHRTLAEACGRSDQRAMRFALGRFADYPRGVPRLEDAQANLLCSVEAMHDHGSHTIVIGRVDEVIQARAIGPLLFLDGRFHAARAATE